LAVRCTRKVYDAIAINHRRGSPVRGEAPRGYCARGTRRPRLALHSREGETPRGPLAARGSPSRGGGSAGGCREVDPPQARHRAEGGRGGIVDAGGAVGREDLEPRAPVGAPRLPQVVQQGDARLVVARAPFHPAAQRRKRAPRGRASDEINQSASREPAAAGDEQRVQRGGDRTLAKAAPRSVTAVPDMLTWRRVPL